MTQNKTPQMSSFESTISDEFRLYDDPFEHRASDKSSMDAQTAAPKPFPFQKVFITAIDADGRLVDVR